MFIKFFRFFVVLFFLLALCALGVGLVGGVIYYTRLTNDLPKIEKVSDYRPKAVTQLFSEDGTLMAEAYEERRYPVKFEDIPQLVKDAFLAAEDASFYTHPGIDFVSILRAGIKNLENKQAVQGASTITQQVVKSLLLTREKTLTRKAKEAILSYRLEKALSKNDILSIYLNEIYLGSNAYGVKAAARVHFHKELNQLTVAEAAFLGGLPQKPSVYTTKQNRRAAIDRQHYVLDQMMQHRMITREQFDLARAQELVIYPPDDVTIYHAPYFSSHVMRMIDEYLAQVSPGDTTNDPGGYVVHSTCDLKATHEAEQSLQAGLRDVDKRRGWRGPAIRMDEIAKKEKKEEDVAKLLSKVKEEDLALATLYYARVESIEPKTKNFVIKVGDVPGLIVPKDNGWARKYLQKNGKDANDEKVSTVQLEQVLKVGDVIEVSLPNLPVPKDGPKEVAKDGPPDIYKKDEQGRVVFQLDQTPEIEGAIVLSNALTGQVKVIVGGYDFRRSVFNRATQGLRQPGSSFKPIIYTTAVDDRDFTPSTIVPDAPITLKAGNGEMWSPQNFDHEYLGPITLRTALQKSRNVVSVYLLRRVGVDKVVDMARRFGITTPIPREMSIALGTAEVRLLEITRAYGVFAAGGWLLDPMFFGKIEDRDGKVVYEQRPHYREVISEETAFIMANMMKGVVERGTATTVRALNRPVAGKTGTTNEHMDAWFIGYTPEWVAGIWTGFDEKRNIGKMETGGRIAAPIFLNFMQKFLAGTPPTDFMIPDGVIPVLVDVRSGHLTSSDDPKAFVEYFKSGTEPMTSDQSEQAPQDYLTSDEF